MVLRLMWLACGRSWLQFVLYYQGCLCFNSNPTKPETAAQPPKASFAKHPQLTRGPPLPPPPHPCSCGRTASESLSSWPAAPGSAEASSPHGLGEGDPGGSPGPCLCCPILRCSCKPFQQVRAHPQKRVGLLHQPSIAGDTEAYTRACQYEYKQNKIKNTTN